MKTTIPVEILAARARNHLEGVQLELRAGDLDKALIRLGAAIAQIDAIIDNC